MYEEQTYEAIMQRLLDNVPDTLDKREGSFIWDALSPAALELAEAYRQLDLVLQFGFAQTTYGQFLDYRAAEHGLERKAATKATGQVTITGSNGTVVPAGSLFATGAGIQFQTTTDVTIGESGSVTVDIEAVEAGAKGNVPADTITEIPVSIAGVTAVTNENPTTGGTDEESDTALLARLLEKVRMPATSGNEAHYKQWALEVDGVGGVKVFPLWNGPGTVKLLIVDENMQANEALEQTVYEHIEKLRPIGADVTIDSPTELNISVKAKVNLGQGYNIQTVQNEFVQNLEEYRKSIVFKESYVSFAYVGKLLFDTDGVLDYADLTLNEEMQNITIGEEEIPVFSVELEVM